MPYSLAQLTPSAKRPVSDAAAQFALRQRVNFEAPDTATRPSMPGGWGAVGVVGSLRGASQAWLEQKQDLPIED